MSEPVVNSNQIPESYSPKTPMLVNMMEAAQQKSMPNKNEMPRPSIITKKFMLVGFETAIDLKESHWAGMDNVKSSLKANLGIIANKVMPMRFIGIWEADPNADYNKPDNHSKRLYFYGVETLSLDNIPAGCVIKDLPESAFAVFKEKKHDSPKYEWLAAAGYKPDRKFQQKFALDLEIYDYVDSDGDEWDVVIPIKGEIR